MFLFYLYLYYENNINSLVYVLQELANLPQANFIFSSSCTVYGQAEKMPITEDASVQAANSPYGNTKQIGEEIINDVAKVTNINAVLLRYFNPIGAHSSAEIGELPIGVPQNLVPFITQTAYGLRKELSVYGNDYPTPDGTCIRDYIHVTDLAKAHIFALRAVEKAMISHIYNVGSGRGYSVKEVMDEVSSAIGKDLDPILAIRRPGDSPKLIASIDKIGKELGWKPERTLKEMIASSWSAWRSAGGKR